MSEPTTTTTVVILGKKKFRKWVVEKILALEKELVDSRQTQEKIDNLTRQLEANREKMKGVQT
jgi:hypothetical protein